MEKSATVRDCVTWFGCGCRVNDLLLDSYSDQCNRRTSSSSLCSRFKVSVSTPQAVPLEQLSVESQIRRIFKNDSKMALAISQAENGTRGCDRTHRNADGSFDTGVFQINSVHAAKGNLFDCTENIRIAYKIYKTSGWNPWVVYQTGAYKKFLTN